jgi:hypothetical protein
MRTNPLASVGGWRRSAQDQAAAVGVELDRVSVDTRQLGVEQKRILGLQQVDRR